MPGFKNVVITGAGTGIGRALSLGFVSDGCRVVGLGRTSSSLQETQGLCRNKNFTFKVVDVAKDELVDAVFSEINSEIGPIDVLINNAAVYPREYFLDQSANDWTQTILINICGVANCCRAVLPQMLARNAGRIINIGSLADINPIPASSAYSVSKGGLHSLTRALSAEIDRDRYPNVLINELNPGANKTRMSTSGQEPASVYPFAKQLVELQAGGPTGRMFLNGREIRPGEGIRARLKRLLFFG
jgi:2-hydroxycyclohexanecarboxyl-CoA dehydrogenase